MDTIRVERGDVLTVACDVLDRFVDENDKQRFEFDEDSVLIRARQGHSVPADLGWPERPPPELLYHGTAPRSLAAIRADGLRKGTRHHLHLSDDAAAARAVGARHGRPVLLAIRASDMHRDGYRFFLSTNGVWLTDNVPPQYVTGLHWIARHDSRPL